MMVSIFPLAVFICLFRLKAIRGSNIGSGWSPYVEEDYTVNASYPARNTWNLDDMDQYQNDFAHGHSSQQGK